jgi:hypothetical protein
MWKPIASLDRLESSASTEAEPKYEMDDWWRVAVMVAAVIVGVALILYVGVERAAGM